MKHTKPFTQASAILQFYQQLTPDFPLPEGVEVLNPFGDAGAWALTGAFYEKFYNDQRPRTYIFGINPGRFGGGITGIPFTDPIRLQAECGIVNDCAKKAELSSLFIYEMIAAYGGPEHFYSDFFITAVSPLGFTRNGINLNYYDDKALMKAARGFIVDCIRYEQQHIPGGRTCICLGEGANYKYFAALNAEYGFFDTILPLPHPRWIMQYRRKTKTVFVDRYLEALTSAHPGSLPVTTDSASPAGNRVKK